MTTSDSVGLRLLAVHAHPDDEASKGAPVMAMYAHQGAEVMVATCTGGERGDVLNPALAADPSVLANLPEVRRAEMANAARILGVQHRWLGFADSGYPEGLETGNPAPLPADCFATLDVAEAAAPLVALIREFRPHVVTTYDEQGGYPHPDHIMCHKVSAFAYAAAGDPAYTDCAAAPWQPIKLYYNQTFSHARLAALHDALSAQGDSQLEAMVERLSKRPDRPVHAKIPAAEFFPQRDDALRAHATQVDPNGLFFALPPEQVAEVWPTEEYELGHSFIPTADLEDDLFAGIRGTRLVEAGAGDLRDGPIELLHMTPVQDEL